MMFSTSLKDVTDDELIEYARKNPGCLVGRLEIDYRNICNVRVPGKIHKDARRVLALDKKDGRGASKGKR